MTLLLYLGVWQVFWWIFWGSIDLVILYEDNEFRPGPSSNSSQKYHWNLNSIATLNFSKIPLSKLYTTIHTYDIICVARTDISHDTSIDDDNLSMLGYELIKVDPTIKSKTKRYFLLMSVSKQCKLFKRCLNFNLIVNEKQGNITLIYCLPSQSSVEF